MFRYITYKRRGRKTTKKIRKRLFWQRWDRLHVNRAADVSCGARNILLLAQGSILVYAHWRGRKVETSYLPLGCRRREAELLNMERRMSTSSHYIALSTCLLTFLCRRYFIEPWIYYFIFPPHPTVESRHRFHVSTDAQLITSPAWRRIRDKKRGK